MRRLSLLSNMFLMTVLTLGCAATEQVIPESLEAQVDKSVTFEQLKESPDSYRGKLVVLGGEVLKAKRLKDGTQLEVLQLPLENGQPASPRNESQGRFLAIQKEFLDPATVTDETRVTIVGEVMGATTQHLDEMEYRYPTIEVKHLKVWEPLPVYEPPARPRWGIYGGGGSRGGYGGVGVGIGF
ncbi:MAG: Slp family lipoprotein [Nitrospiraceae bacterium]